MLCLSTNPVFIVHRKLISGLLAQGKDDLKQKTKLLSLTVGNVHTNVPIASDGI